ncbi:unnamed protein product [Lampetra fluviatilis]
MVGGGGRLLGGSRRLEELTQHTKIDAASINSARTEVSEREREREEVVVVEEEETQAAVFTGLLPATRFRGLTDELILELVSSSAALIQQATTVTNKDIRMSLDGIYVSE